MKNLKERYGDTALITGASAGIGQAFAETLAEQQFNLVLVARRGERLEAMKRALEDRQDIRVLPLACDLAEAGAAGRIATEVSQAGMEISLLINNAGFGSHGEFDRLDLRRETAMADLNCRSVLEMTHAFLPGMKARRRGGIIIVGSVLSLLPGPYMATYTASKAFDLSFAESLHGECKPHHVDVLGLLPGTTQTEFFAVGNMRRRYVQKGATPKHVVQTALAALGKKPYVVDSLGNKFLVFCSHFLPRRWLIALSRLALRPAPDDHGS